MKFKKPEGEKQEKKKVYEDKEKEEEKEDQDDDKPKLSTAYEKFNKKERIYRRGK